MPAASAQLTDFLPASRANDAPAAPGFLGRVFEAIHRAQTRRAERDIARFIERRGGRMTDELERTIERHFV